MVSAISDRLSRLKPSTYITANVPTSESGTVTAGISVAAHVAQEQEDHQHDQADREHQRELHVGDRGADGLRAVDDDRRSSSPAGSTRVEPRQRALMRSTVSITLAPGCLKTISRTRRACRSARPRA